MSGSELQVMVVEDHGFQRRIALRLLSELGIERVLEGSDGLHALDVLRKQATPPDVVLVDLDMPGMDGIELSQKATQLYPDLKVMFITGFAAVSLRANREQPQAKVLSKPFHLKDLVMEVDRALADPHFALG